MIKLKNAQGILSTEVPTGNLIWVDPINGNDKLALRGRLTIPFRTLTKAKEAARAATFDVAGAVTVAGDTIVVLPGVYNEGNLLKHGVNWHFMAGARVAISGGLIFDTGAAGTNGAVTTRITGWGDFYAGGGGSGVLACTIGASDVYLEAISLVAENSCIYVTAANRVNVRVLRNIENGGVGDAAIVIGTGTNYICADQVISSSTPCVAITGGSLHLTVSRIDANGDSAVTISGGEGFIHAFEIISHSDVAVLHNASNGSLIINGARIVSVLEAAIWFDHVGSNADKIRLMNCVLMAGGTYSVDAVDTGPHIQCVGTYAAKAENATHIDVVGDLVVYSSPPIS